MLSFPLLPPPPSPAVLLTYFMAHRQRQEECLLLSVVSRSVGQHTDLCMLSSFSPLFKALLGDFRK